MGFWREELFKEIHLMEEETNDLLVIITTTIQELLYSPSDKVIRNYLRSNYSSGDCSSA